MHFHIVQDLVVHMHYHTVQDPVVHVHFHVVLRPSGALSRSPRPSGARALCSPRPSGALSNSPRPSGALSCSAGPSGARWCGHARHAISCTIVIGMLQSRGTPLASGMWSTLVSLRCTRHASEPSHSAVSRRTPRDVHSVLHTVCCTQCVLQCSKYSVVHIVLYTV